MPVFRMNTKIKSRFMPKPTLGGRSQRAAALPFDPTEATTPMGAAPSPLSVPRSDSTELARAVTLILASAGDLHRVPWLLPQARYYVCEVVVIDDATEQLDLATWAFLNEHGVIVRFVDVNSENANVALDSILTSASGELIVALDSYRCEDISDVAGLLEGDAKGAEFMKDLMVLGETEIRSHGRREASIAWRYSNSNGAAIRDFGVGSFALQRNAVPRILSIPRPATGGGSPLGREALASLAVAASLMHLSIHEAPVYACEREADPLTMEFLDQLTAAGRFLPAQNVQWHNTVAAVHEEETLVAESIAAMEAHIASI